MVTTDDYPILVTTSCGDSDKRQFFRTRPGYGPGTASAESPIHKPGATPLATAVYRVQTSVAGQLRRAGLWEAAEILEGASSMEQLARQMEEI